MVEAQLGWFLAAAAAIALGWTIWASRRRGTVVAAASDERLRESRTHAATAATIAAAEIDRLERMLDAAQRRVAELEAEQQKMMTRLKNERTVAVDKTRNNPAPAPEPVRSGVDLATSALAIARIEGQIARQFDEYNQRPRKKFIGARVEEYRFAQYIEDWRQKIERVGNLNYPAAAKGRLYGSLVLTVIIKANGDLDSVEVSRSSGKDLLDDAARRIVQMAAPYAAFPEAIKRDTDVLEITRTWTFTNADRLRSD